MPRVGSLSTSLTLESQQFVVGLKKAVEQTQTSVSKIEKGFGQLQAAAQATAAALALDAVAGAAKRGLDYASALGEVSQQLGVTTADLQIYRFAASQAGIEQETMDKALAKLTVTLGKARDGAKGPADAFRELSVLAGRDIVGSAQSAGDAIPLIADALAKIDDPAKRARLEVELFGKAGQKLDTLLAGGRGQIDELRNAAQRLGIVIDDKFIQQADEAADKLAAMKQVLEARIAGVVAENADALVKLADSIFTLGGAVGDFLGRDPQRALALIGALAGARVGAAGGPIGVATGALLGGAAGYALGPEGAEQQRTRRDADIDLLRRSVAAGPNNRVRGRERVALDRIKLAQLERERLAETGLILNPGRTPSINGVQLGSRTPAPSFGGIGRTGGRPKATRRAASKSAPDDPFEYLNRDIRESVNGIGVDPVELGKIVITLDKSNSPALARIFDDSFARSGEAKLGINLDVSAESWEEADKKAGEYLQNYRDQVQQIEEERARLWEDTTQTMAGLYRSLFTGGTKAVWEDFRAIGLQVIAELLAKFTIAKLSGKAFDFGGALGSVLTSVGFGGFRAVGGPVKANTSYIVGENGPERFVSGVPGTVIPNHALGGGGGLMRVEIVDTTGLFVTRVQEVTTPMILQVGQASVVGGAGLARKQLAKSASQRLGR